jgi:hypothetical protein
LVRDVTSAKQFKWSKSYIDLIHEVYLEVVILQMYSLFFKVG